MRYFHQMRGPQQEITDGAGLRFSCATRHINRIYLPAGQACNAGSASCLKIKNVPLLVPRVPTSEALATVGAAKIAKATKWLMIEIFRKFASLLKYRGRNLTNHLPESIEIF